MGHMPFRALLSAAAGARGPGRRLIALAPVALLLGGSCGPTTGGGPAHSTAPSPSSPLASLPALSPAATSRPAQQATHVFLVVMENRSFADAIAQPYTAQLAATYGVATNYHAVGHPSLPNYLAMTSGSTWGITDDGYHRLPPGGLGAQLTEQNVSWRAYMEGMTGGCFGAGRGYALKYNPFAYYGGNCPANVVPMSQFDADLAAGAPRFVWITPDLCNDGHDCDSRVADGFLGGLVPRILASPAWRDGGLLLVTWDEDDGSADNRVLTLAMAPHLAAHQSAQRYDHVSLLATVEDRLGVPRLPAAAGARPFADLVG
jgi:phosphatidylinositol-3-phosphatase